MEECSSLTQNLMLYLLSHFECDGHTVRVLAQQHQPPPLTGTAKLLLLMYVHWSPLSLAAGLHWCCTKFILRLLLREQMENHAAVANSFIQTATNEPDLAPYDFWLFSKLKSPLKGKRFQTYNEIQENTMQQLMVIPKRILQCFEHWNRRWENCVRSQGAYFEGDWGIIVLCTIFLVCCTLLNKCLYFTYYTAWRVLDRPSCILMFLPANT